MKNALIRDRRGFTLVELFIVISMIGILAGIVVPNLATAVFKAHAADVLGDLNVIRVAYHQYLADGATRTSNAAWATVPGDLEPYLPGGFSIETDVAEYRWIRVRASASPWGLEMAQLRVRPKANVRTRLIAELRAMAYNEFTIVTANQARYYLLPVEGGQD